MKISFLQIGKTTESYIEKGYQIFEKRIKKYLLFDTITIKNIKASKYTNIEEYKKYEGRLVLSMLESTDTLVLLDERGVQLSSHEFAKFIENHIIKGTKHLVFISGGAYGFSDEIYNRCKERISLSKMTFSHQMVRLFFIEQLYRALTIIKNEPYHH